MRWNRVPSETHVFNNDYNYAVYAYMYDKETGLAAQAGPGDEAIGVYIFWLMIWLYDETLLYRTTDES